MADLSATQVVHVDSPASDVGGGIGQRALARVGPVTLAIAAASGAALVLGLIRLGTPSFWVDEAFTARQMHHVFPNPWYQYHWLYYAVERPWAAVAGTSEWALRLPSVIGTMTACALLVVLAHRLFDRRVALVSGLLLATSPFLVKWSQQARGYTLLVAVALLATLVLIRALERGTRGAWLLYGIAFTAVAVWHPVGGFLLVPAHVALAAQRRERLLPHGLLAAVVIGALAVPWAGQFAMRSIGENAGMNWLHAPSPEVAVHALLDVSGAAGLGLGLAVLGLWLLRRAGRLDPAVWLGVWALAPFALALLVSTFRPIYLDRYLIIASPAFALLAAVAIMGVGPRLRAALAVAVVIATGVGLAQWYVEADDGSWRGEDWRSAVQTVVERRSEDEPIVVVPWAAAPAARYYGAQVSDVSVADSIWVLTWSESGKEFRASEEPGLGFGRHRLVERTHFGWRVTAEHWQRTP